MSKSLLLSFALTLCLCSNAFAHFGMVIPSTDTVMDKKNANITVNVSFSHPMEMVGMNMEKPKNFAIITDNSKEDLLPTLKASTVMGKKAWQADYTLKKPGVYQFIVEPTPYWEPAEQCFIIHYTKVFVAAFGEEEGWDKPAGLKTEIVPLTRPFGNYAGNVFQGQVLVDGKPVANATVEVEFFNKNQQYKAPNDYLVTQTIKADAQGIFTYAVPFAGWWGFAALTTAKETISHEGKAMPVEQGAVLWTNFINPQKSK